MGIAKLFAFHANAKNQNGNCKVVYVKRKRNKLNNKTVEPSKQDNEVECIVKYLKKEDSFVKSFHLNCCDYSTAHQTAWRVRKIFKKSPKKS